jgi:HlyD family secretion protein
MTIPVSSSPESGGNAEPDRRKDTATGLPLLVVDRAGRDADEDRSSGAGGRGGRRGLRRAGAFLLLVLGLGAGIGAERAGLPEVLLARLGPSGQQEPSARDAAAVLDRPPAAAATRRGGGPGVVYGLGRLVPEGFVLTVSAPFGAGDARIAQLVVQEGDRVARGDLLAELDNADTHAAAVTSAQATVALREAELARARVAAAASLGETRAALGRAQVSLATAKRDLRRADELFAGGHMTQAAHDDRSDAVVAARHEVNRLTASLARYEEDENGMAPDVAVATRALEVARAALVSARSDLARSQVRAPAPGVVLDIRARPGERPGTDGILDLGEIDRMQAEVEIYQTRIGEVSVGDLVTLTADAFDGEVQGTVTRIGWEVGRQTATEADPAARTDARVVKIYVSLAPEAVKRVRRYTNLQVTARIETGAGAGGGGQGGAAGK